MQKILAELNSRCGWDCVIKSFDGWSLNLFSGTAPEYASPLATFLGVSYISCPTEFSHPQFRVASEAERADIAHLVPLEREEHVIAIEAETMAGLGRYIFFLVAESAVVAGDT